MKNVTLFTLGTPYGGWLPLAKFVCDSAPPGVDLAVPEFGAWHERAVGSATTPLEGGAHKTSIPTAFNDAVLQMAAEALCRAHAAEGAWGGTDERTCWTIEYWAKRCPDASFLIFVEPVEVALARWLGTVARPDPEAFVAAWREGAERILRAVRNNRARMLLIDTQEAHCDSEALLAVCSDYVGFQFSSPSIAGLADDPDALSLALARQWVDGDKHLRRICAELEASCTPLLADGQTHANGEPEVSLVAALAQYAELRNRTCVLTEAKTRLEEEVDRLAHECRAVQSALAAEQSLLMAQRAESDSISEALRAECTKAREENEVLLLQLHQVQEELEATFINSQELQKRCMDAEAKLAEATRKASESERKFEDATKALQVVDNALAAAEAELSAERAKADKLRQTAAEQDLQRGKLQELSAENELLLLQLHQVQEELEATIINGQGVQKRCRDVEAQLAESTRTVSERERKLKEATSALQAADEARTVAEAVLSAERAKADKFRQAAAEHELQRGKLQELSAENELLLLQLHQVQEELEHYFLANQKLLGEQAEQANGGVASFRVRALQRGNVCDEAPHRHVNFALRDIEHNGRKLALLDMRLVEHHGVPGLALFADEAASSMPLAGWKPTGQEAGRTFMLLHPAHKHSRELLAAMSASDWQLITDLVELIVTRAPDPALRLSPRWRITALRLREQLAELPLRFRYDGVRLSETAGSNDETLLDIEFENGGYGSRLHPQLHIRWRIGVRSGMSASAPAYLELIAPGKARADGSMPPLATWPITPEGNWAESVQLCFGKGLSAVKKRCQWTSLSAGDRAFVVALLNLLPTIAAVDNASGGGKLPDQQALTALAERMTKEAQRAMRPAGFRRVARVLVPPVRAAA